MRILCGKFQRHYLKFAIIHFVMTPRTYSRHGLCRIHHSRRRRGRLVPYDDDGNQTLVTTKTGTWRVTYNGENRPVRWKRLNSSTPNSNTPSLITMSFDHMSRRREYLEVAANGTTNRHNRFTYDNYLCVVRNRWQPDGTSAADRFVWDPTEPVATRPLVFYQPNVPPQLYAHDGNKNVSEFVSADTGTITAHYEYASFGEVILSSGDLALANPFRFSSEYADDALGLVYYNYRHLEPVTGRWLNRDPIEEKGGENLYAFSGNNPILYVDINGESFWDDLIDSAKIVVGICGVVSGAALGAATSWTGAGAAGGFAMVTIGLDQVMEGVNSIYSRVSGGPATDTSPIKEFISQSSYVITGSQNSKLEQYAISAYSGVQLASSCYGGFVSLQTAIQAVRMTYVPAHTVRIMTIEKGFLRYSWELKAGYWKLSGGSDAAQAVFEISVDGMTYFEHDAENEDVKVNNDVDY